LVWGTNVPFDAPWLGSPWNSWCPLWYLPLAPTTHVAPSSRKSLLYPIYSVGTNPNAHVWLFWKAIQANGEERDVNIMNLFCFTLRNAILEWGKNFIQFHSGCTFLELKFAFCKQYHIVQNDE
jgi:hypothetical protein